MLKHPPKLPNASHGSSYAKTGTGSRHSCHIAGLVSELNCFLRIAQKGIKSLVSISLSNAAAIIVRSETYHWKHYCEKKGH